MDKINNIYKILAILTMLAAAGQIAAYFYLIAPGTRKVKKAEGNLNLTKTELRRNSWPSNMETIRSIKQEYIDRLEGADDGKSISELLTKAMTMAGSTFSPVIKRDYSSVTEFMRNASRLDYQAEHSRAFGDMAKRGFILEPKIVGLDEDDPSPYIYQLMLHLWTVEKLVNAAADSGLALLPADSVAYTDRRNRKKTTQQENERNLAVLPMKTYTTNEGKNPYLLEFPVRIKLKGTLPQAISFLSAIQHDDKFIPAGSFEIFAMPPEKIISTADGTIQPGLLNLNLVCSSYFALPKVEK